jgi:HEAT repeat protein
MASAYVLAYTLLVAAAAGPSGAQARPAPKKTASAAAPATPSGLQAILDKKELQGSYNPVLLDFLAEEGQSKLSPPLRKAAMDQLVAGFKQETQISQGTQATAAVATALGALLGGSTGRTIEDAAAQVWASWVDAAFVLERAGYGAETRPFFEKCLQTFPYDSLRARCAAGLARSAPDQAIAILTGLLAGSNPVEIQNVALRLLGGLATAEGLPKEQHDAIVDDLIKRTHGFMNSSNFEAAVDGLAQTRDPRAVEPLRGLTKGFAKGDEVKRAAKRALLLVFQDAGAREALKKDLKGGFVAQPENQVFAAHTLIDAGDPAGFDWARDYLSKKKKDADYSGELIWALAGKGGEPAHAALAAAAAMRKPGELVTASMSIALLSLGDASRIDVVRAALMNKDWPNTRLEAAVALAGQKDYSGVPVLESLTRDTSLFKKALDAVLGARSLDPASVKSAVASALGRIDHSESVPVLISLLGDKTDAVRLSAAFALAAMSDPAALDGLTRALETDYGQHEGRTRNPEVHAHLVRSAALHFAADPRTALLVKMASESKFVSVRFLALAEAK